MRKPHFIRIGVLVICLLSGLAQAATFQLAGGQTVAGEPVSPSEDGTILRQDDGSYSDRIPWGKFSPDDLKKMAAADPKVAAYVEQFIEPSEEEKKAAEKIALIVKTDFERLDRPAPQALLKSLFSSGVGLFGLFLIYAANLYAGYEISIFRARSPSLGCGVAAALPILGPIIFLCLPTQVESKGDIAREPARERESYHVGEALPEGQKANPIRLRVPEAAQFATLPATQTFASGEFTFTRHFFETRFPGFFTIVRQNAQKDMVLILKSTYGEHIVQRITRVSQDELHLLVQNDHATEEVMIPFAEIQEVILKHKDA